MTYKNKTILITGASKGIGRELAVQLAKQQANLGLVARSEKELVNLKTEIEALGANTEIFVGDVADESLVNQTVEKLLQKFERIDVLVNNAGFGIFEQAENIASEEWDSVMNTNVKGTFMFSKAVIPSMKTAGAGHIITIASDVARRVFDGGSLYCASKYAQDAFSMALRKEVRKHNIKVSIVYSGLVDTHFHAHPQGDEKAKTWLTSADMADSIIYIMSAPAHVVIDELMIHPMSQDY
ncbi:MAG: SDR family oxidoreductase [Verrucomicrobia bacterium]|nr:SDR family oxidoreductase [Cytophagales bacterium]